MKKTNLIDRLRVNPTTSEMLREFGIEYLPVESRGPVPVLPGAVSIRSLMTPVRNQGGLGTCASYAALSNFEFIIKNPTAGFPAEANINLSESHITHAVEKLRGDCVAGLAVVEVSYYLHYNGCVEEDSWPYDGRYVCNPSPPNLSAARRFYWDWTGTLADTLLFHRDNSLTLKNFHDVAAGHSVVMTAPYWVDYVRQHLAQENRPVVVDVPVFWAGGGYEAGWGTGYITMPTSVNVKHWLHETAAIAAIPGSAGWHAICIVGYDDVTRRFEFKNSWGSWGDQGFGTIPYEYITTYTRDAWGIKGGHWTGTGPPPYGI